MMSLTIGDPPQKMMAIVDTGSDVTWFQCLLCTDCYPQNLPTFVPSISTTYDTINCNTKTCDKLREHWCELDDSDDDKNNDNNVCKYKVEYADGSFTNGTLSKDLFGLETKGSNDINFPMIVFGCSRNADDRFDEEGTGLIGLDMGPLSFVSQFGVFIDWKFSHCLGRYGNPNSSGRIFFGKDAMLLGTPTPMVTKPKSAPDHELYYVNLIDISVDHKRLNIHPERFLPR
ncbi:Aspartic proteinase PCS1 [Acorus gramineus]|uniref:Aspartic proteinase PCS1 n=1 Tax=Acorus gramineus TaxID=55184 RepID=A0AAV9A881_ACOGR|nr:Aspartic proteinase PCS1 [Acorus gramineus]